MHEYIDLAALGRVLLASLVGGVGLVSVFGLGLVGLSAHRGQVQEGSHAGGPAGGPGWLALSGLCFLVVVGGIALGLWTIIG